MFLVCVAVVMVAGKLSFSPDRDAVINQPPLRDLQSMVLGSGAALLVVYLLQTRLDRRPFAEVGLSIPWRGAFGGWSRGAVLGGSSVALAALGSWALGAILLDQCLGNPAAGRFWIAPLGGLLAHLGVGFQEELLCRGYLLQSLSRRLGPVTAILFSSIVFSLLHACQPGFTPLVLGNLFLAGIMLSVIFLHYQSLWPAIGFHFAWNWVQYHVLQLAQAGSHIRQGLLVFRPNPALPAALSGATYGMEGTLLVTLVVLAFIAHFGRGLIRRRAASRSQPETI